MKRFIIILFGSLFIKICSAEQVFSHFLMNEFQQESIMKLSSLYGYTRYFYPNPFLDKMDWHIFLEKSTKEVIAMSNEQELNDFLLKTFSVFIPELKLSSEALSKDSSLVHTPYYIKENILQPGRRNKIVESKIIKIENRDIATLSLSALYSFPLCSTLYACYPLGLQTLPLKTAALDQVIKDNKVSWEKEFYNSPYFRIANAIIGDTYLQHFYAYYDDDNLKSVWRESCKDYVKQVANSTSYKEYLESSYIHYADINDGHLFIMNGYHKPEAMFGKYLPIYYPDIVIQHIDGKIYIVDYTTTYKNLRTGDEIISVNKIPTSTMIEKKWKYISAATDASRYDKLCDMFFFQSFKKDSVIGIEVKHSDSLIENVPITTNRSTWREVKEDSFITQLSDGIWKINPCNVEGASYKTFSKYINRFQEAKGLIIDIRGYPDGSILPILSHFIDEKAMVGQILTPTYYFPNHENVKYQITESSKWGIYPATENFKKEWEYEKPLSVRIKTPVVFLTNSRAISFAETIMEIVKSNKIGTIIGESTAGTNGNAVIVSSPTIGYIFTGYKFLTQNGEKHHGIGVIPDIKCPINAGDLQNGIDTQVIRACELLNQITK